MLIRNGNIKEETSEFDAEEQDHIIKFLHGTHTNALTAFLYIIIITFLAVHGTGRWHGVNLNIK